MTIPEPFTAEQLQRFLFHLLFFFRDVGNYVAQNVERSDTGISRATDGLHSHRHDRFQTKVTGRSGASAMTSPMAEQLGLVTTKPPDFLAPGLCFDQLDVLRRLLRESPAERLPACAMRWSWKLRRIPRPRMPAPVRRQLLASSAAKITLRQHFSASAGETVILPTAARDRRLEPPARGLAHRRLPSERSDAASHATSNHGCCSSICTNRCPTMPVAPRIPTGTFFDI